MAYFCCYSRIKSSQSKVSSSLFTCVSLILQFLSSIPFQEATVSGETYVEALRALQGYVSLLAERAREGDQMGEFCHWADGYHLNVRLYEMLLCSVFDIMNEGKIMEVSCLDLSCLYDVFLSIIKLGLMRWFLMVLASRWSWDQFKEYNGITISTHNTTYNLCHGIINSSMDILGLYGQLNMVFFSPDFIIVY